jgi:Flp pilus assembly pilin Flp
MATHCSLDPQSAARDETARGWRRLHRDERGAVSLETILIIGAVSLPILIFVVKYGWPRVRDYFSRNMQTLENEASRVSGVK